VFFVIGLAGLLAGPLNLQPPQPQPPLPPDKRAPVEDPDKKARERVDGTGRPADDWSLGRIGDGSRLAVTGQLMRPAGTVLNVKGSPRSLALARSDKYLVAKSSTAVAVADAATFKLVAELPYPDKDGGSMHGLAVSAAGTTVYYTGRHSALYSATVGEDGQLTAGPTIKLAAGPRPVYPLGVGLFGDDRFAAVALSIDNQVAIVDLAAGKVTARIDVGVCPYGVAVTPDGKTAFVTNFGGPRAKPEDRTGKSAGTDVAVDERSVALRGSVSVIDLATKAVVATVETRIHPEALAVSPDGTTVYVVDASGDGVTVIDAARRKAVGTLGTRPRPDLPYGSLSSGIAVGRDGATVYVANAGNNAVALIDPKRGEAPFALIPAGGFPAAVCVGEKAVFVGNAEGYGGDLQRVPLTADPAELKKLTATAEQGYHLPDILRAVERQRTGVKPVPVPRNPGEPSTLRHVVYVIKENKKFDQVLGDIGKGRCEPKFCEFPRAITPNTHALADQFVLLDNYYCCSGNSANGHQWAVQGLVTPYRVKGEAPRVAYDFGTDALTYAGCGFVWDHAIRAGVSFRNFGELDYPKLVKGKTWKDFYRGWKAKDGSAAFECGYRIDVLRKYSDLRYPGWQMGIPDQVRADVFLTALAEFEKAGQMPGLTIVYLPNDHTEGPKKDHPTPRAYVADNDLATGRIVEALSKTKFWKDMAVFVNEDDPQTGADHVSGYRSLCLVASPYAKRGAVVSRFYNQASVLHTICNILGMPPMNQTVAAAPLMDECFTPTPDPKPFACLPAGVALDEMNPDPKDPKAKAMLDLMPQFRAMDFSRPDRLTPAQQDVFGRYVWSTVRPNAPFPAEYAGPHGKGLKALGLSLESIGAEPDDD
jgi:YVTN family beta-propeller protein